MSSSFSNKYCSRRKQLTYSGLYKQILFSDCYFANVSSETDFDQDPSFSQSTIIQSSCFNSCDYVLYNSLFPAIDLSDSLNVFNSTFGNIKSHRILQEYIHKKSAQPIIPHQFISSKLFKFEDTTFHDCCASGHGMDGCGGALFFRPSVKVDENGSKDESTYTTIIVSCLFNRCAATDCGGAIYIADGPSTTINLTTFHSCHTKTLAGNGGACQLAGISRSFTMDFSTIIHCTAAGSGGAVHVDEGGFAGKCILKKNVFSYCFSEKEKGGALSVLFPSDEVYLSELFFAFCSAPTGGGGGLYLLLSEQFSENEASLSFFDHTDNANVVGLSPSNRQNPLISSCLFSSCEGGSKGHDANIWKWNSHESNKRGNPNAFSNLFYQCKSNIKKGRVYLSSENKMLDELIELEEMKVVEPTRPTYNESHTITTTEELLKDRKTMIIVISVLGSVMGIALVAVAITLIILLVKSSRSNSKNAIKYLPLFDDNTTEELPSVIDLSSNKESQEEEEDFEEDLGVDETEEEKQRRKERGPLFPIQEVEENNELIENSIS
eukprot:MONOS_113.1-p1 / transcript=MONOS_113.1 / gene=MONOS_113 / organism=Monocercomonoides_exilis_PA203 / gene_product=unspecified product / transcript_product=unspecified product / location=Mono_scaffold00002:171574-173223(-) / protein_length=550 / sequence_SO=supercontig / SO=protein_coding / is_pseudo=false